MDTENPQVRIDAHSDSSIFNASFFPPHGLVEKLIIPWYHNVGVWQFLIFGSRMRRRHERRIWYLNALKWGLSLNTPLLLEVFHRRSIYHPCHPEWEREVCWDVWSAPDGTEAAMMSELSYKPRPMRDEIYIMCEATAIDSKRRKERFDWMIGQSREVLVIPQSELMLQRYIYRLYARKYTD